MIQQMIDLTNKIPAHDIHSFLISSDLTVLHFDDEPILFTGRNRYNQLLLCSAVDDEHYHQITQHFHSIISLQLYSQFMNKGITYKELLKQADRVYLVQSDNEGKTSGYILDFTDIPDDHMPSDTSYFEMEDDNNE